MGFFLGGVGVSNQLLFDWLWCPVHGREFTSGMLTAQSDKPLLLLYELHVWCLSHHLKIQVYAHISVLLPSLGREASFCSCWQWLLRLITGRSCDDFWCLAINGTATYLPYSSENTTGEWKRARSSVEVWGTDFQTWHGCCTPDSWQFWLPEQDLHKIGSSTP